MLHRHPILSLLTLLSMVRIWAGVFWSPIEEPSGPLATGPAVPDGGRTRFGQPGMLLSAAAVVACSLAVTAAAGPLYALSSRTAHDLLDRTDYISEVSRR